MFEIVWGRFRDIYFLQTAQTKEKLTWNAQTIKFLFAPWRNCTTPPVWREFGKRSKKSLDQSKQILLQIQIMSGLQIQTNDVEGGVVVVQFCLQYSIPVIKSNKSSDIYIRNRTFAWDTFLFPSLTSWNPQECWILLPPPPRPTKGLILPKTDKVVHYNCRCFLFWLIWHIYFASIYRAGDNFNLIVQELGGPQVVRSVFKSMTC